MVEDDDALRRAEDILSQAWSGDVDSTSALQPSSADRYLRIAKIFVRYARSRGASDLNCLTPAVCEGFITATSRAGLAPSRATSRLRLAALRGAFTVWQCVGLTGHDPTVGMRVPSGGVARQGPCPLTPVEARRLGQFGRVSPTDTLRPVAVALAMAGASHVELASAVVADLNSSAKKIWIGRALCTSRCVELDSTSQHALALRVAAQRQVWRGRGQPWDPALVPLAMHRPLSTYPASSVAPTVSMNLSRALVRAGIVRPAVRPRSLREYAANRTYAITRRVEDVAAQLGLLSLDTAARFIDPGWQDSWAEAVRRNADG